MNVSWLLVGAGDIARKRVGNALTSDPRSNLKAVCDSNRELAEDFAVKYGKNSPLTVYDSLDKALKDDRVDTVYIATPVYHHKEMAVRALEAGKNVLVEKPMALTYPDASRMVEKAEQTGMKLGVAYFRRMLPKYGYLKEMLDNDEFGKIVLVRMAYFSWYDPDPDDPKHWRVIKKKSGGGVISDMGTHMFDLMIGLFGLPLSVIARVETNIHAYDVEDSAVALMKLKNGAQVTASLHWCSKTWSHEFEVVGTEAKVKWHPFDDPKFLKTAGRNVETVEVLDIENVHKPLIESYTSWIIDGTDFVCSGREAMKTNRLIDAVYESSRSGQEIEL